jgi:phosphoribosylanthranilate isomerase
MIVKVCGMRDAENIREVEALGVDWMGFVFHRNSPRFDGELPDYLPQRAKRVGVFVDETEEQIMETVQLFRLDMVQLHGHEAPDFCSRIRSKGLKVIKAINVQNHISIGKVSFSMKGLAIIFCSTRNENAVARRFGAEIRLELSVGISGYYTFSA